MLSLNRFILPVILGLAVAVAAQAQTLSSSDAAATRAAVAAAQAGDWNRASADVAAISDPLPLKMLRWLNYASPGAPGRFAEIADFIEKNPAWPRQKALRMHAEEALAGETDAVAAAWFARFPPLSATGQIRAAEIKLKSGDVAGSTAALRTVWVGSDFNALDEKSFLANHGAGITPQDNQNRLDRLLWDGKVEAVRRMLSRVPPDSPRVGRGASRLVAACPGGRPARCTRAGAVAGRFRAALRGIARAARKGHDRRRGCDPARQFGGSAAPRGMVA